MSQKQMPKKKQSTQTELFAYVKTAKYRFKIVPIQYGEQQKKMAKRIWNWYFIYQFHPRPFMSLNWYPVYHQNKTMINKRKMATLMPFDDRRSGYGETHVISFVFTRQNQKFLNDTRETSLLTALLFSQLVLSSCLRTAHFERLCC